MPVLVVYGSLSLVDQQGGQVGGEYLGVEVLIGTSTPKPEKFSISSLDFKALYLSSTPQRR